MEIIFGNRSRKSALGSGASSGSANAFPAKARAEEFAHRLLALRGDLIRHLHEFGPHLAIQPARAFQPANAARAELWERTAEYLRTEKPEGEFLIVEECGKSEEADDVASH